MVPLPHLLQDLPQIPTTQIHILNFTFLGYEQASIIIIITTTTRMMMMVIMMIIDKIKTNKAE